MVYLFNFWTITLVDEVDLSTLPGRFAKLPCFYHFASDAKEPPEAALSSIQPDGLVWDKSEYSVLRPGVMLSSGRDETSGELLTTSGVEVINKNGTVYVTVASHGFPLGQETVYHPDESGKAVGNVEVRLANSDIALMRLTSRRRYENVTFTTIAADGTELAGGPINNVRDPFHPAAWGRHDNEQSVLRPPGRNPSRHRTKTHSVGRARGEISLGEAKLVVDGFRSIRSVRRELRLRNCRR